MSDYDYKKHCTEDAVVIGAPMAESSGGRGGNRPVNVDAVGHGGPPPDAACCGAQHCFFKPCVTKDWAWVGTVHLYLALMQLGWMAYIVLSFTVRIGVVDDATGLYIVMAVLMLPYVFFTIAFLCKYCTIRRIISYENANGECVRIGIFSTILCLFDAIMIIVIVAGVAQVYSIDEVRDNLHLVDDDIMIEFMIASTLMMVNLYLCIICVAGVNRFNNYHWNLAAYKAKNHGNPGNMSAAGFDAAPVPLSPEQSRRWRSLPCMVFVASCMNLGYLGYIASLAGPEAYEYLWIVWVFVLLYFAVSVPTFFYSFPWRPASLLRGSTSVFNGIDHDLKHGTVLSPWAEAGLGVTAIYAGLAWFFWTFAALISADSGEVEIMHPMWIMSLAWTIIATLMIRRMRSYDKHQVRALSAQMNQPAQVIGAPAVGRVVAVETIN